MLLFATQLSQASSPRNYASQVIREGYHNVLISPFQLGICPTCPVLFTVNRPFKDHLAILGTTSFIQRIGWDMFCARNAAPMSVPRLPRREEAGRAIKVLRLESLDLGHHFHHPIEGFFGSRNK